MTSQDPAAVARRYVEAIDARDLDALADLMTSNHWFIDTGRNAMRGQRAARDAWDRFLREFPDYEIRIDDIDVRGNDVLLVGHATCSEPKLTGPTIWEATIDDDRVALWRTHMDSTFTRERLGLVEATAGTARRE